MNNFIDDLKEFFKKKSFSNKIKENNGNVTQKSTN